MLCILTESCRGQTSNSIACFLLKPCAFLNMKSKSKTLRTSHVIND